MSLSLSGAMTLSLGSYAGAGATALTASTFATDGVTQQAIAQTVVQSGFTFFQTNTGIRSGGTVEIHRYDHATGKRDTMPLHYRKQVEDHVPGGMCALPSGRIFTTYQTHGDTNGFNWCVSVNDPTSNFTHWRAPQIAGTGKGSCAYSEAYVMGDHVFVFQRMNGATTNTRGYWWTTVAELEAYGLNRTTLPVWAAVEYLLNTSQRPYVTLRRADATTLDGMCIPANITEGSTSLYHFVCKYDGTSTLKFYLSDGTTEIVAAQPFAPTEFTLVKSDAAGNMGYLDCARVSGAPVMLSYRQPTGGSTTADRVYAIHKYSGGSWSNTDFLTAQGTPINSLTNLNHVAGACLDGNDPTAMYVIEKTSTYATLGGALVKWSIDWTGLTATRGATLAAESVGTGIMRPFSPVGHHANDPVYYVEQNGTDWVNFDNYNGNIKLYGVYNAEAVPAAYEAEATALFARCAVQPSDAYKIEYNQFYKNFKVGKGSGSDILSISGIVGFHAAETEQQALLDLVDVPGTGANNFTKLLSPTFTAGRGFNGDATNRVLFLAPNAIPRLTQNNAGVAAFGGYHATVQSSVWGTVTAQLVALCGRSGYVRAHSGTQVTYSSPITGGSFQGFTGGGRNVSTHAFSVGNHNASGLVANTSSAPSSDQRYTAGNAAKAQFSWAGSCPTEPQLADMFFAVHRFLRETRGIEG